VLSPNTGDYCERGDLPAGFLTAREENWINEGLDEDEVDPDEDFIPGSANLLEMAMCRFREVATKVDPFRLLFRHWLKEAQGLPEPERSQASTLAVGRNMVDYYPETES